MVYGAEPAGADDASRSLASGRVEPMNNPVTIADGLRSTISQRTLQAMRTHVKSIATCSEGAIVAAMRLVWERAKIVIEPSAAVPLAAMVEGSLDVKGLRVGVIVSGGNVDLDHLPWQRHDANGHA
jgi:threonine dehydratase